MSQNSADSANGNNSKNIPAVVNNHADRLMDELFADIEELLSGDLNEQQKVRPAANIAIEGTAAAGVPAHQEQPALSQPTPAPTPAPVAADPPRSGSVWKKVLLGLGLTALLAGGGLWWLMKSGKMPAFSGLSNSASNADIKFADYLGKAVNKLDSSSVPSPAANSISIPNPPGVGESTLPPAPTASALPASANISFAKITAENPPTVEFVVDGIPLQVKAGDTIGNSGWVLKSINAATNEATITRNGELHSLKAGQQL